MLNWIHGHTTYLGQAGRQFLSPDRAGAGHLQTNMDYPVDVWAEILLRVPFEYLIELKYVCKCWHELIDNRNFIDMHRDLHFTRSVRFVYRRCVCSGTTSSLYDLSFDFGDQEDDVQVLVTRLPPIVDGLQFKFRLHDSCDGLLLITPGYTYTFILYNPNTRSCEFLPDIDCVFTPSVFWDWKILRDAKTNRYTIIELHTRDFKLENTSRLSQTTKCLILELDGCDHDQSTSSWKELIPPRDMIGKIEVRGIRKNRKIHWLFTRFLAEIVQDSFSKLLRTSLLSFEPGKQQFRIKPCSPMPISRYWTLWDSFFECNITFYRLFAVSYHEFELWSLRDLDRRRPVWMKIHVIGAEPLFRTFGRMVFRPLAVVGGSNKLIMVSWPRSEIAVYDLLSNEWTLPDIELDEDEESESELESIIGHATALFPIN